MQMQLQQPSKYYGDQKVKNLGNHIVLFTFDNKLEVDNIISSEPWNFDKHLMVLQCYDKDISVEAVATPRSFHGVSRNTLN